MADAQSYLTDLLNQYGLGSLSDWAWEQLAAGATPEQVIQSLRQRPEYAARFPAMADLSAKGRAMSENEYLAYERTAAQMMRAAGLPAGFFDQPEDFGRLISNEVSVAELQQRIMKAETAALQTAEATGFREQMFNLYGVSPEPGDLTAFFLDPDIAEPLLTTKYEAARRGQTAVGTGYGQLTAAEAEQASKVSYEQAQQGFSTLTQSRELFGAMDAGETDIGRETQLGAVFDANAADVARIEQRRRRRQAEFEEGGGYAVGQTGVTGVR